MHVVTKQELALLLRELRSKRNISQEALSKEIGISKGTIYRLENARINHPDANHIGILATYFNTYINMVPEGWEPQ